MRLDYLGHASWLAAVSELRLAFDPQLFDRHAGGVFQIFPPRTIEAEALRPDFIFVSHAHFDHFDVDSLAALARADAASVLVTSDPLVEEVGHILGFETVRRVAPATRVELAEGLTITTTPSVAPDVEWGLLLEHASGTVWNMIDTVFETPADVTRVKRSVLGERPLDLALAPIQPMSEIAMATAGNVGFDAGYYRHLIACGAASEGRVLAPSACGEAFRGPYQAMNGYVYPVSRARAARDVARFAPGLRTLVPTLGEALAVEGGEVAIVPGQTAITRTGGSDDPRVFRPIEPAPLFDPNEPGYARDRMWRRIWAFCEDELSPALARELAPAELQLVLEVVFDDAREAITFDTKGRVERRFEPEYDVLVSAAASLLYEVLEGRRAWVEPLLGGFLRSSVRGASLSEGRVHPLAVAPIFPYYGLSYRASLERSVRLRAREAATAGAAVRR